MNTREILSIVALAALGLCLLSGLAKMAMKGPKAKQSCDHACSLLVFVAIVLLGVSQLLEEEGYKELDLPFWEPGVGALPWTFSGEGKMKGNKASMGVTGPTPTFSPQDTHCKHHVNKDSYCMTWKDPPVCHGVGAIPCPTQPAPTPAPPKYISCKCDNDCNKGDKQRKARASKRSPLNPDGAPEYCQTYSDRKSRGTAALYPDKKNYCAPKFTSKNQGKSGSATKWGDDPLYCVGGSSTGRAPGLWSNACCHPGMAGTRCPELDTC